MPHAGTNSADHSGSSPDERRRSVRYAHAEVSTLSTLWGDVSCHVLDISMRGARLHLPTGLLPPEGAEATLRLSGGQYISGALVWSEGAELGLEFAGPLSALEDILWVEQRARDWIFANVQAQARRA